ncbi:MAG: biotin--[acetyl-CoA-carboxylase] ligase [Bacteroidales bacterium]|nr:biotin--[acetyl-CoA-carboxylase] ligase [Bacteroidales bacterium]
MIIGSDLIFYENLSSTNSQASLLLKKKDIKEGTVVYSDFQTAGRGQSGNIWESEAGKNLLISIILYPSSINPEEQFHISMAVSLGICDFIDRYIPGSKIKWPNDIYIKDGKISGILIENSIMGESIESAVAGIGLNINQEKFTSHSLNPVSFRLITGRKYDLGICLKQLLADLDLRYKQLLYGNRELLANEYIARLHRFMEWCTYRSGDIIFTGKILNVTSSGRLQIRKKKGKVMEFSFKEVDFIP